MFVSKIRGSRPVVAVALATAACLGSTLHASASTGLKSIQDPGHVTYSVRLGSCHFRDGGQLPDPSCTPGSVDPVVSQANTHATICKPQWWQKVAPPLAQFQHARFRVAYPAYRVGAHADYRLDYLVPLELGGSNDITNLWPASDPGIDDQKDMVERQLVEAVCDGDVTLAAAQNAMASNWVTAIQRLGLATGPLGGRRH